MHIVYKLIALSVVFGLVLTTPTADENVSLEAFDDEGYDFEEIADVAENNSMDKGRVLPGLALLPVALGLIAKVLGLKVKAVVFVAKLIKSLTPKIIFLVLGAVAAFAFCKITNLCSLSYTPVVYDLVPPQYRSFVTPDQLEYAQDCLTGALNQYVGYYY